MLRQNPYLSPFTKSWVEDDALLSNILESRLQTLKQGQLGSSAIEQKQDAIAAAEKILTQTSNDARGDLKNNTESVYASSPSLTKIDAQSILLEIGAFIENRAQEELRLLFLNRLNKQLDQSILKDLFPETREIFTRFELSNYKNEFAKALPSFRKDLQNMGLNFANFISKKEEFKFTPSVYNAAYLLGMIQQASNGEKIDDLLLFTKNKYQKHSLEVDHILQEKLLKDPVTLQTSLNAIETLMNKAYKLDSIEKKNIDKLITYLKSTQSGFGDTLSYNRLLTKLKRSKANLSTEQFWKNNRSQLSEIKRSLDSSPLFDLGKTYRLEDIQNLYFKEEQSVVAKKLWSIVEIWRDTALYSPIRAWVQEGKKVNNEIRQFRLNQDLNKKDTINWVLNTYRTYWLLRKGLEWEEKAARNNQQSGKKVDTLAFFVRTTIHPSILQMVVSIEQSYFKSATLDGPEKMVFDSVQELEKFNKGLWSIAGPWWKNFKHGGQSPFPSIGAFLDKFAQLKTQLKLKPSSADLDLAVNDILNKLLEINAFTEISTENDNLFLKMLVDSVFIEQSIPELDIISKEIEDYQQKFLQLEHTREDLNKIIQGFEKGQYQKVKDNAQRMSMLAEMGFNVLNCFRLEVPATLKVQLKPASNLAPNSSNQLVSPSNGNASQKQQVSIEYEWITQEQLRQVMIEPQQKAAFLGVLYHQVTCGSNELVPAGHIEPLVTKVLDVLSTIKQNQIKQAEKKEAGDAMELKDYLAVVENCVHLFNHLLLMPNAKGQTLEEKWGMKKLNVVLSQSLDLYKNLDSKRYTLALDNILGLFQIILSDTLPKNKAFRQVQFLFSKYGNFLVDAAEAKTREDIHSLLKTYAAPVGSSQIKRLNDQVLSLNAYLGVSIGREQKEDAKSYTWMRSFSTPIGLAYSFRRGKEKYNYRQSWTLFLPVLDIGPIITYDFEAKQKPAIKKLKFEDFLAPGLAAFYNFDRSPFSVGLGWQRFETIRTDITTEDRISGHRFLLSFLIDVPLIHFTNHKKTFRSND